MSDSDEPEVLYLMWQNIKKRRKRRTMWVRDIFLHRPTLGEYFHLKPQLDEDDEMFYSYYRMNRRTYEMLVLKTKPHLNLGHTHCRQTISFEERLAVTIRFLANGENYHSASFRFRISHNCIGQIVSEMLPLIYDALKNDYLKFPNKNDFVKISQEFMETKHFPNCLGAIDGKHVRIRKPSNAGSLFYNYKQFHSIVLLAVVDAKYLFTMIDVGSYGKNSDGGVFNTSKFGQMFNNAQLELPDDKPIVNCNVPLPYVFIGDEAFRLARNLLKPYPRRDLNIAKRRFNYRLSHARQVVECSFGMLATKFRIFESPIAISPDKIDNVIKAACVLHNFIRIEENIFEHPETLNVNVAAFENVTYLPEVGGRNLNQSTREARLVRDKFTEYFSGTGNTSWQDEIIFNRDEIILNRDEM